jgi:MFS family permease
MDLSDSEKLDLLIEKLNLSRLDSLMLNGILLPLSMLSLGLIVGWVLYPIPASSLSNVLSIVVIFMFGTLFAPLVFYAYAYVADRIETRVFAIGFLFLYGSIAFLFAGFLGVIRLHELLRFQLPQFAFIINISSAFTLLTFTIFLPPLLLFTLSSLTLARVGRWLTSHIPKRLIREGINPRQRWTMFLFLSIFTRSRKLFMFSFAITAVELTLIEVLWIAGILVTAPLDQTWKTAFLMGGMMYALIFLGFLRYCWSAYKDLGSQQTLGLDH